MGDIVNHDICALVGQFKRDRFADTAVSASDNCDFVLQRHVNLGIMDFAKTGNSIPRTSRASHNLNIYGREGVSGTEKSSRIPHSVTLALRDPIKRAEPRPRVTAQSDALAWSVSVYPRSSQSRDTSASNSPACICLSQSLYYHNRN